MEMAGNRVSFITIKEDFNEYRIENGQILKVKNIVMDIFNEIKDGKTFAGISFNTVSSIVTTVPIDTSTMELEDPVNVTEKDETGELNFEPIKQTTNIYETEKAIIITHIKMEKIFSTRKKDSTGSPILRHSYSTIVNVMPKPDLNLK